MQKAAKTSRLIDLSFKGRVADLESPVSHDGSLQNLILSRLAHSARPHQVFTDVASRFIRLAEHLYSTRDMKRLEESSRVLMNLPLARARQIGLFYQGLTVKRSGQTKEAQSLFETTADHGPLPYRARAIQALGALHYDKGQPAEALRFHLEAVRAASNETAHNALATLLVQLQISQIQGHLGDHQRALADLETIASLVRFVAQQYPLYFYFYHNSLAVEFAELGRLAEAEAACTIALASPFADAYPEYAQTRDEIAAKRQAASPSVVAVNRTHETDRAPESDPAPRAEPQRQPEPSFGWLASKKTSLQVPLTAIRAFAALVDGRTNRNTLDQLGSCIKARAPPGYLN